MSLESLNNVQLGRRRFRPKRREREPSRDNTRDELLDFIHHNHIRRSRDVNKVRIVGEPTVPDVIKEFGSWAEAMKVAWPSGPPFEVKITDRNQLAEYVIRNRIRTANQYRAHSKADSDIPSLWVVLRIFKTWARCRAYCMHIAGDTQLDEYSRLRRRLGRPPTVKDLKNSGVRIDIAQRRARMMDISLDDLAQSKFGGEYENKRRNSR